MSEKTRKLWKIAKIVLIVILVLAALAVAFFFFMTFHGLNFDHSTDDLTKYDAYLDKVYNSREHMPTLASCGSYQKAGLSHRHQESFYGFDSVCLFLEYSPEEYDAQKQRIEENYRFYSKPTETLQDVSGNVGGYWIRLADRDLSDYFLVKECLFIGLNDESNTIVYAYWYDDELDFIPDMDKILEEFFNFPGKWKS